MAESKNSRTSRRADRFASDTAVLPKYNYGTGFGWATKRELKAKNRGKGQTSGRTKGPTCQATPLQRHFAKSSRAYKHKSYQSWVESTRGDKK